MKPYFTKYLPVEGGIQHGDKVQYRTGEIVDYVVPLNTDNLRKVKILLCSRDIQVGDEYYTNDGNKYKTPLEPDEDFFKSNNERFKVIGEISPDAIWVKEGMEFDEDEVIGYFEKLPYDENHKVLIDKALLQFGKMLIYKIKCPTCKHFH